MSERSHAKAEHHHKNHENLVSKEHHSRNQELAAEKARKALAEHAEQDHQALAQEAAKHAQESSKHKIDHAASERRDDLTLPGVQQTMKDRAYKRELAKVQTKLPKTSRRFSKVVHNKTVETVSNIGAQTVARPSGLLGGSIVAFAGSLVLYFMAKQYGFRYNYLVMFLLFIAGFAVGALLELVTWSFSGRHKHSPGTRK